MTGQRGDLAPLSRLDWLWVVLPYVLLTTSAVVAWTSGELTGSHSVQAAAVAAALVVWHTWWVTLHPQWLEARLVPMAVYFIGLVAMVHGLVALSFAFFPVYLISYPMAFVALPGGWAYGGVGLTAAIALLTMEPVSVVNVILGLGAAALVAVTGGTIRALEQQTARRKAAMAELQRTHDDLQAALARNLELQEQLQAEARQAGIAAERSRLAGEIHDTLAAGLSGVLSQFEALSAELPTDHPLHQRLRVGSDLARETLQDARRSVRALRPAALHESTLPTALADIIARFERDHAVTVTSAVTGDHMTLPDQVEDVVIRSAQEALTNVGRHAAASTVYLTLSYLGDTVILDVADNGTGFPADQTGAGHGLGIMQERVHTLGGAVDIDTASGEGTTITVSIPLRQESDHGSA